MAATQLSPGVRSVEKDASLIVPGTSTSVGAVVGAFQWGPVMDPVLVSNEDILVSVFGKPDNETFPYFFNAADFLAYSNALYVTRVATTNTNAVATGTAILIKNLEDYEENFENGAANVGEFAARYPGTLGNSILVSMADSATFATWTYKGEFSAAPGTSEYVQQRGGSDDELHIIVVDALGLLTGTAGAILERFAFVSKASDAMSFNGTTNYYKNVLKNQSQYIYWMDHPSTGPSAGTNWGSNSTTVFDTLAAVVTHQLIGGTDDNLPTDGELMSAFDIYSDDQRFDISLIPCGKASADVVEYVQVNIAEKRGDCVAFGSVSDLTTGEPIFGSSLTPQDDAVEFRDALPSTSYGFLDSGYKYRYDKYNDLMRWVTLNADIAGLCARTDQTNDTWFSPGGLTRGQIKNVVKLAFNPNQAQRDVLYSSSINPVVSFPGQGVVLYGDKTQTSKPSAFDRLNVRRLFITLKKSISTAAKYTLFEFNDQITRNSFVAAVEPFLRDVQGRRGITDFRVICDETNNTPDVIARNEFRATILVRPNYSINFIELTFTAVGPNVSFEEAALV